MKAELLISWLLRIGVGLSGMFVVAGMIVMIIGNPAGEHIANLGLLLLIATPVARVAASIFLFARERDFTFVIITTTVLLLLLLSFVLGAAGG